MADDSVTRVGDAIHSIVSFLMWVCLFVCFVEWVGFVLWRFSFGFGLCFVVWGLCDGEGNVG